MLNDRLDKGQAFRLFTTATGAMLVASVLISVLNPLLGFYDADGNYTNGGFWWANVICQLAVLIAVVVVCGLYKVNYFDAVNLKKFPKATTFLCALGLGVGVYFFMNPIQLWILQLLSSMGYHSTSSVPISSDPTTVILLVAVVCLLPAVVEEQLFRGAILGGLKEFKPLIACLIGGGLFMIFHMNPAQTVHQFVMGVVLTFIALGCDSLYPTIAVHFVNNLIVILLVLTLGADGADGLVLKYWYAFLLGGLAVAGVSFYFFCKLTKNQREEKVQPTVAMEDAKPKALDKKTSAKNGESGDMMILFAGVLACTVIWLTNLSSNIGG